MADATTATLVSLAGKTTIGRQVVADRNGTVGMIRDRIGTRTNLSQGVSVEVNIPTNSAGSPSTTVPVPSLAEQIADRVSAVPGIAGLHGGAFKK